MSADSPRVVPNIPPVGLRAVEETCIVCADDLKSVAVRYPLRLALTRRGRKLDPLLIGYACTDCHGGRADEVRAAQFVAAQRYLHVQTALGD